MNFLYRDFDYGALAVVQEGGSIRLINHGFVDGDPVYALLDEVATRLDAKNQPENESTWRSSTPGVLAAVLIANIDQMLREGGYVDDPLAERTVRSIKAADAVSPDLPVAGKIHVSEAVERAVAAHLNRAFGALEVEGAVQAQVMEAFPRPHAVGKRRLPFIRAQARVEVGADFSESRAADVCKRFREALEPLKGSLVRATAELAEGVLWIEAGICLPAELVEEFEAGGLPAFAQSTDRGYRQAWLRPADASVAALDRVRERASACSAAHSIRQVEGGLVLVSVPAVYEDSHTGDPAFSERINWLAAELGAELVDVGDFCEGAPPPADAEALAEAMPRLSGKPDFTVSSDDGWSTWGVTYGRGTVLLWAKLGSAWGQEGEFTLAELPKSGKWKPDFLRGMPRAIPADAVALIRRKAPGFTRKVGGKVMVTSRKGRKFLAVIVPGSGKLGPVARLRDPENPKVPTGNSWNVDTLANGFAGRNPAVETGVMLASDNSDGLPAREVQKIVALTEAQLAEALGSDTPPAGITANDGFTKYYGFTDVVIPVRGGVLATVLIQRRSLTGGAGARDRSGEKIVALTRKDGQIGPDRWAVRTLESDSYGPPATRTGVQGQFGSLDGPTVRKLVVLAKNAH